MSTNGLGSVDSSLEDDIDLQQYIKAILKNKWRILALSLVITVFSALISLSITPIYTGSTSVLIESTNTKVVSIEEIYGVDTKQKEYFQTQYEILKSKKIAAKVISDLDLVNNPYFIDPNAKPSLIKQLKNLIKGWLPFMPQKSTSEPDAKAIEDAKLRTAMGKYFSSLTISPVRNTQVVVIEFESESPELAAMIANEIADTYIESYLEAKLEMTSKATSWLSESLQGLRDKLTESEQRLATFYEDNQLVDVDGVVGLASDELQQLTRDLLEAETKLKQAELVYEEVNKHNGDVDELSRVSEVLNHPSIQNVKRAELEAASRVSELSEVYGPKHQKMISAMAELNSIRGSLAKQVRDLVSGITNEFKQAKSRVESLKTYVSQAKVEFRRLSALEARRQTLQREVDINQQLYDSFFTRLKETNEIGGLETANARVLDEAEVPVKPSKPNKVLIVLASFVLSCGFGIVVTLILEALNQGIRSVDDVEKKLSQHMLGLVPWQKHAKKQDLPLKQYFDPEHHAFSESIRTLRTSLKLLNRDAKVVMVTSSVPKEGKTTIALNLAFALGQVGKVLLIDADLRRPSIAKRFGLAGFQPGLANLMSGTHSLNECLVSEKSTNIDILPAGMIPSNPQELLGSNRFMDYINSFKGAYDHIVVDTAPTQAVSDAFLLSNVVDSILYVVKADSTSVKVINSGLDRFMKLGKRISGVVINQLVVSKGGSGINYSGFYDSYGYHTPNQEVDQTPKS